MGEHLKHVRDAAQYADDVIAGEIVACDFVKLACERFFRDLKRQKKPKFPFYFDAEAGDRACRFISKLPHIKGEWAKKKLKISLEPWQSFIIVNIFGWKCDRTLYDDDGFVLMERDTRRFRTVYEEVARKNAKSTKMAGIGLYLLVEDGEVGAEVYSSATTHKQAKIVWQDAKAMAERSAGFRRHYGAQTNAKNISVVDTSSKFEPLHSQGETLDGLNVHAAINDELHAHKKRELYDVLETATGSRLQPLMLNITTAGSNRAGICYELRSYAIKVLQRVIKDESFFGIVFTLDKEDEPLDRSVWRKANPNYGVSVYPFDMERLAKKAEESPASMNNFLTKRLNVWVNADSSWMNMREWDQCADPTLREEDFVNDECWIGVDLASKIDMNCVVRLYKRVINGETHVFAFPTFYLPDLAVEKGKNSQYGGWKRQGLVKTTPGNIIDMDLIEEDVVEFSDALQLEECCFDPGHNATQWAGHLEDEGVEMIEVRPTVLNFSEPLKWWEALVLDRRFHHTGHAVMTWMVSNVVVREDNKGNIYPRKERTENLIDGPVAVCIGMNRLLAAENEERDPEVVSA